MRDIIAGKNSGRQCESISCKYLTAISDLWGTSGHNRQGGHRAREPYKLPEDDSAVQRGALLSQAHILQGHQS